MHQLTVRLAGLARATRARAAQEDGVVVAIAILAMTVIVILSGMVVMSSVDTSGQATAQTNRAIATQAANAGLQAALYRLDAQPAPGITAADCFTTADAGLPGASGCPGLTDSYGSAIYTYYVSPVLSQTPNTCTGLWINAIAGMDVSERCITSIGTAGGISIRMQERVAAYSFTLTSGGILSLSDMQWDTTKPQTIVLGGTYQANGAISVGTNGQDTPDSFSNATVQYGPAGSLTLASGVTCKAPNCVASQKSTAFTHPTNLPVSDYTQSAATNNNNALLTAAWANNSGGPGAPPKNPQYAYNATTRILNANNVGSATSPAILPSGVYNFCDVTLQNSYIQVATGANVIIYIDAPATGDGCSGGGPAPAPDPDGNGPAPKSCQPANAGGFNMPGPSQMFYNPNQNPLSLQIRVYGVPGWNSTCPPQRGQGMVNLDNWCNPPNNTASQACSADAAAPKPTYGEIYAPDSFVTTADPGLSWAGGIVAGNFESNDNDLFQFAPTPPTQLFYPSAFTQCPTAPTSGNRTTGCY